MKGSALRLIKAFIQLVTSSEQIHYFTRNDFLRNTPPGRSSPYFRFSANLGLSNITLDAWKSLRAIKEATELYMGGEAQEIEALRCIEALLCKEDEEKTA